MENIRLVRFFCRRNGNPVDRCGHVYYVVDEHENEYQIGFSSSRSTKNLVYDVCPEFVHRFQWLLSLGSIEKFYRKLDFEAWIHRQMYYSFAGLSTENVQVPWFVKACTVKYRHSPSLMPAPYRHIFQGVNENCWILFQSGWKVYPLLVIGNQITAGWAEFWQDHKLREHDMLLLGCEREWLFDVKVLNRNGERIPYDWTDEVEKVNFMLPHPEELRTAFFSSILATGDYDIEFGHFYVSAQVLKKELCKRFAEYLLDDGVTELKFSMGASECTVKKHGQVLEQESLASFITSLDLAYLSFIYVGAVSSDDIRVLVFDRNGIERWYIWVT